MSNYYGFIDYKEGGYTLTIEYGELNDSPYDYSQTLDKKEGLTKEQVNDMIKSDTLGTQYIYKGTVIGLLW